MVMKPSPPSPARLQPTSPGPGGTAQSTGSPLSATSRLENASSAQEELSFDWDAYETRQTQQDLPSPRSIQASTKNPFRQRMIRRESQNTFPDLITFEPDEKNDSTNTQQAHRALTEAMQPSTQINVGTPSKTNLFPISEPLGTPLSQVSGPGQSEKTPKHDLGKDTSEKPPQIVISPSVPAAERSVESVKETAKQQRNEFYQIKHIRWRDVASPQSPRESPILIQNANGPCPLLALVNTLVLTTPSTIQTALVETLHTREQISLGLLLDAVFDELMSDRRRSSAVGLPDVSELYSFLVTLHTGMNVNPRFIPGANMASTNSNTVLNLPGSFEETRETKLYGTFSIPVIHGWLPHRNEKAYAAFERAAPTYEDAQNIQFQEEDLQNQLSSGDISAESRQLLDDLITIKQFFVYWPTQLSAHGLDVIDKFLQPGRMAILFRNDHFSTLYKEPRSNRLMTLVTDAGYSTHDEIVWETLVDINGANSELCAGDFRSISHAEQPEPSLIDQSVDNEGWTTVQPKNIRARRPVSNIQNSHPQSPQLPSKQKALPEAPPVAPRDTTSLESSTTVTPSAMMPRARTASEQEDHDLALALQLQEEEEERQRNEAAARRARENDLSEQYIARERPLAERGGLRIPVRRSAPQNQTSNPPPANAGASEDNNNDIPPPSYEEAAAESPFHPPRSHPSSEHAPLSTGTSQRQNTLAYRPPQEQPTGQRRMTAQQSLMQQNNPPTQPFGIPQGRRTRSEVGSLQSPKEDKCSVM